MCLCESKTHLKPRPQSLHHFVKFVLVGLVSGSGNGKGLDCVLVARPTPEVVQRLDRRNCAELKCALEAMARKTMMTGALNLKSLLFAAICSSIRLPCASAFATGLLPSCDATCVGHLVAYGGLTRGQKFATSPLRPMHFAHGQQVRRWGAPRRSKQSSTTMVIGAGAQVYEALHAIGLSLPVAWFKMLVRSSLRFAGK